MIYYYREDEDGKVRVYPGACPKELLTEQAKLKLNYLQQKKKNKKR